MAGFDVFSFQDTPGRPLKTLLLSLILAACALPLLGEPMTFKSVWNGGNCQSCAWIAAEGDITSETPANLRAFLENAPYLRALQLNSPGGDLGAALELGRIIRAYGVTTEIGKTVEEIPYDGSEPDPEIGAFHEKVAGGTCESACAFAFLAGVERKFFTGEDGAPAAQLGMHQFFLQDGREIPTEDTQKIMGQVLLYVLEMGINAEVLTLAARTPPDQMHFLTPQELSDLGVLPAVGPASMDLRVVHGGLAVGAKAILASGQVDRTITLRCSRATEGWTLQVRFHDIGSPRFETYRARRDENYIEVGPQKFSVQASDILEERDLGAEHLLELRLPAALPAFSGQTFRFYGIGLGARIVEGALITLPDAETFSVLARACGD